MDKKGLAYIIAASTFYGIIPTLNKLLVLEGLTESSLTVYYSAASVIICFLVSVSRGSNLAIGKGRIVRYWVLGALGLGMTGFLLTLSYSRLSVGIAEVLYYMYPIIILVAGLIIKRRKPTGTHLAIITAAVAGLFMFSGEKTSFDLLGAAQALLAAVLYAGYFMVNEKDTFEGPNSVKLFYLTSGTFLCFSVYALSNGSMTLPSGLPAWIILAAAILLACASPYLMLNGIQRMGAERAGFLNILEPLIAFVVGCIVFRDKLAMPMLVGAGLLLTATFLNSFTQKD